MAAGRESEIRPTIIVDTREPTPLVFPTLPSMAGTLTTGDYSLAGGEELFAVERKSVADLAACCIGDNRARFERELHRLRGFWFAREMTRTAERVLAATTPAAPGIVRPPRKGEVGSSASL
jgi:hypothetical protein